jgi:hypothetical protein
VAVLRLTDITYTNKEARMGTAGMRLGLLMISVIALGADQVSELRIGFPDCPAAVQKTLKREAFEAEIKGVYKEGEETEAVYEADVVIDGKKYEIRVAGDGTLLEKEWEEEEEKMQLSDCPTAVQKTFRKESFGAKIETVEKESTYGRTIYEADAVIDGNNYEIKVAAEGALISKKRSQKSK